jgi:hypothetical protein
MSLIIEKINNKIFCFNCEKKTVHTPKLSAILEGKAVCTKCSVMNGICTLKKEKDKYFIQTSSRVLWIEFNENGRGKKTHEKIGIDRSLIMSPFSVYFTWQTTLVKQVIEEKNNYVKFKTENTVYELYFHDFYALEEK